MSPSVLRSTASPLSSLAGIQTLTTFCVTKAMSSILSIAIERLTIHFT